ncbi:LysM peptidoglycan-binding domain-containing protein [Psychromarinibacter sp. C21-152]|uniref:LysM peptidoglycan-binding domain-containing protein n=1 Tax=Psychromarinibacter sediminicola TaxID=3033385 RepID=A0AAE3NVN9_9RHOB|nr:LysM peptidoglycan-binding domain-containing protein [Psychromarinibacter sediminicola]MDF0602982.1 LysM peptidoglycan-binding domain-containing protein [Psychromarinibacter sediminicola]
MPGRRLPLITAAAATLALTAGAAQAQTRCGATYTVSPGDTFYDIGQRCGVSLSLIAELNPDTDPRDLRVGEELRLSSRARNDDGSAPAPDSRPEQTDGTYQVQEGDTAWSIAQALGLSVIELMNQNPDLRPYSMAVGDVLDVPTGDRTAAIDIAPASGPVGTEVTIEARNLRPYDYVTIGVGERASEWRAIDQARTGEAGNLTATVDVPRRFDPGDQLIFVVDTDRGMTLKSLDFEVTARETDAPETVALEGRVMDGVECPVLRTPDGDRYALTSSDIAFTEGEYVEIAGTRADMSFCQQGQATIDVTEIREVSPPDDGDGDGRARVDSAFLRGAWAAETGNCARPAFDIYTEAGGGLAIGTSLEGYARTGDVETGLEGRFVFDRPEIVLAVERRGDDRLSVVAPDGDPVQFAGHDVGEPQVFTRC